MNMGGGEGQAGGGRVDGHQVVSVVLSPLWWRRSRGKERGRGEAKRAGLRDTTRDRQNGL